MMLFLEKHGARLKSFSYLCKMDEISRKPEPSDIVNVENIPKHI